VRTAAPHTFAEEKASQAVDLRKRIVGPVGLEPTTYGLKELPIPVQNVGDPSIRAWFVDAG